MCNLYSNTLPQEAMRRLFNANDRLGNQPPLPNIFPDQEAPVIRSTEGGEREIVSMRWGFPPVKGPVVTNIRNLSSPFWRNWLEKPTYRCLVPATSFSEYHPTEKLPPSAPGRKSRKAVCWFGLNESTKTQRAPFAFAGLWRPWSGERKKDEHGDFELFGFLTTEPNGVVEPIHPKAMPVILPPEAYDQWLHGSTAEAKALQRPLPDDQLQILFVGEARDNAPPFI